MIRKWFVTGLVSILVLTFILWGMGDIVRTGGSYVLRVGDKKIEQVEFERLINAQTGMLEKQFGTQIRSMLDSNPFMRKLIINQIINSLVLKKVSFDMGLQVSDDMAKFEIAGMPEFYKDGKFDPDLFEEMLGQAGIGADQFISFLKEEMSVQNLGMLLDVLRVNLKLRSDQIARAKAQKRVVDIFSLDTSKIPVDGVPADDEMLRIYEEHKSDFMENARYDLSYFELSKKDFNPIIDEKELRELYNTRSAEAAMQKKRFVKQVLFKTKEDAESGRNAMLREDFLTVAKRLFPDKKTFDLGEVAEDSFSKEVAGPIFGAKVGDITEVVASPLGYHIFFVEGATEGKIESFDKLKDSLKKELSEIKIHEALNNALQKIDTMSLNGDKISDIAKVVCAKVQHSKGLVLGSGVMKYSGVASTVENSNEGDVSGAVNITNDRYLVVSVDKVQPKFIKEFKDVKSELVSLWQNEKKSEIGHKIMSDVQKMLQHNPSTSEVRKKYKQVNIQNVELSMGEKSESRSILLPEIFSKSRGAETGVVQEKNLVKFAIIKEIKEGELQLTQNKEVQGLMDAWASDMFDEIVGYAISSGLVEYHQQAE